MKGDPPAASEGRFSLYVFERCLARKDESRLLRFGDQGFGKELERFLEGRPRLRWLHESEAPKRLKGCRKTIHVSHRTKDTRASLVRGCLRVG